MTSSKISRRAINEQTYSKIRNMQWKMLRALIVGLGVIAVAAAAVAATGNATEGRERNKRCTDIRVLINILCIH